MAVQGAWRAIALYTIEWLLGSNSAVRSPHCSDDRYRRFPAVNPAIDDAYRAALPRRAESGRLKFPSCFAALKACKFGNRPGGGGIGCDRGECLLRPPPRTCAGVVLAIKSSVTNLSTTGRQPERRY
jgi:hypothetical protein